MNYQATLKKTQLGQMEIETPKSDLTPHQRRVLILVNGENDGETLSKKSLCDNVDEILTVLMRKGLVDTVEIQHSDDTIPIEEITNNSGASIEVRDFMCNALLTYGNRVRVGILIDEIKAVQNASGLKDFVNVWYRAISETPNGMYEADSLKKNVLQMLG